MPSFGVGLGVGGGASGNSSFGLIFGKLSRASDFSGIGLSGASNVSAFGGGFLFKMGVLGAFGFFRNPYIMVGVSGGVQSDATLHFTAVDIINSSDLMDILSHLGRLNPFRSKDKNDLKGQKEVPAVPGPN